MGGPDDSRVVVFQGTAYHGIRELGFTDNGAFVLSFHTTPAPMPRGGYFTCIPISSREYRAKHPTKCGFRDEGRQLIVWDDWKTMHRIAAPREVLDQLVANMRAHDLPELANEEEKL
jgi:hypothetical protein